MNGVLASAPGKLVVTGEYAVLDGAPAMVLAVNCRASVRLTRRTDDQWHLTARPLGIDFMGHFAHGACQWRGATADDAAKLALVTQTLRQLATRMALPRGLDIVLDTTSFFDAGGHKLGVGSSAALMVALAAGLARLMGQPAPTLAALIALHRSLQEGRGSGIDVAAAVGGGLARFQWIDGAPVVEPVPWPEGMHARVVWVGRSTSTGKALGTLAKWRDAHADAYALTMARLQRAAMAAASPWRTGDTSTIIDGLRGYVQALGAFGRAAGVDIISAEHRALLAMVNRHGLAYKSCGAGGGDVGMVFADDSRALDAFCQQARAAGFGLPDIAADEMGLSIQAV